MGRFKISKKKNVIGLSVLFFAVFVSSFFAFSSFNSRNGAEANSATLNLGVREVISIAIDADDVNLSLTPQFADTKSGTFGVSSTTVKVYTNSDGYKLYMSNKDSSNDLKHSESSVQDKISSLTIAETPTVDDTDSTDSFPVNKWGYSLDTGATKSYSAIPTSTTLLRSINLFASGDYVAFSGAAPGHSGFTSTNGPDSNKPQSTDTTDYDKLISTTVTFGAKVDTSIASGSYKDIVVFDVTGSNVGPVTPEISSTSDWVKTATVTPEDDGPRHDIQGYEYIVLSSGQPYATADSDLTADANTKIPAGDATITGSIEATKNAGAGTDGKDLFTADIKVSGDATISTDGVAYADGIYYVYIRSVDNYGNRSNWSNANIVKLDNTAPTAVSFNQTAYNKVDLSATDEINNVTSFFVSTTNTAPDPSATGWISPDTTGKTSYSLYEFTNSGKHYFWAKDSVGNVSAVSDKSAYTLTIESTYSTVNVRYNSASGAYVAQDIKADTTRIVIEGTTLHIIGAPDTDYLIESAEFDGMSIPFK